MLPSTSSREALVAWPPSPPWNLLSFSVGSTLSSPCSRSDLSLSLSLSLSRQGAALAHLNFLSLPQDLVLWTDGSVPFPSGKGGSGILANCSLCGTESILSFSSGSLFSSFSAKVCAILHTLCWSRQHHQVCHFSSFLLLSEPRSVLSTLSCPPSFLLSQTLWKIWQELFSLSFCTIRLQWIPGHLFLPGNNATDELAGRGVLLAPSAIPCGLSPLISCIHFSLFSNWWRTVSSKFFDTQVHGGTCAPSSCSLCVLSRLRCNGHSLLLSPYLFRIGRFEDTCCSACGHSFQDTSHLILHCPTTKFLRRSLFGDSLSLYDLSFRP